MKNNIEVLAPVGNMEMLHAAIAAGADAVYLAAKSFGARAYADNFTETELEEAVIFAHTFNVKVYVTINTLIFEDELEEVDELVKYLISIHIDAVIVQDLGLIRHLKKRFPCLTIHASTQVNVHSVEASKILKDMGVERIIPGRETPLETIKEISNLGLETEVFVHGALCFSCSGNCFASYLIGNRSGNKGSCAQICRKNFTLLEDGKTVISDKAILSMKDLNTLENLDKILDSGVNSLKIEGRMKSSEFVFSTVFLYKKAVEFYKKGKKFVPTANEINKMLVSFNRTFTKGYILNEANSSLTTKDFVNHQGIKVGKIVKQTPYELSILLSDSIAIGDGLRVKSDTELGLKVQTILVNNDKKTSANKGDIVKFLIKNNAKIGDIVYKTYDHTLHNEVINTPLKDYPKTDVDFYLNLTAGCNPTLTAKTSFTSVKVSLDEVLEASVNEIYEERITEQMSKLGNTAYSLKKLVLLGKNGFIRVSSLNELRRLAVEKLDEYLINQEHNSESMYNLKNTDFSVKEFGIDVVVSNIDQYNYVKSLGIDDVYLYGTDYAYRLGKTNAKFIHSLDQINENAETLSIYGNISNKEGIVLASELGLKTVYLGLETPIESLPAMNIKSMKINVGYFMYGNVDAMVARHCVVGAYYGSANKHCGKCKYHHYTIIDDHGAKYNLGCDEKDDCTMRILSSNKIDNLDNFKFLQKCGITKYELFFTDEKDEEIKKIISYLLENKEN